MNKGTLRGIQIKEKTNLAIENKIDSYEWKHWIIYIFLNTSGPNWTFGHHFYSVTQRPDNFDLFILLTIGFSPSPSLILHFRAETNKNAQVFHLILCFLSRTLNRSQAFYHIRSLPTLLPSISLFTLNLCPRSSKKPHWFHTNCWMWDTFPNLKGCRGPGPKV